VVGVNRFQAAEDQKPHLLRVDESVQAAQVERLQQLRANRDDESAQQALSDLQKAARTDDNLVPFILRAVELYATTGEICGALRRVFGEYQPQTTV
jgi:methylmalonyl-CoA mutase N-terminal domain/subunit